MSRAFVKEDVDPPERSGRKRSASGLPPGATNYITARGAKRLRDELQKLRGSNAGSERIIELEQILASAHVVDPPDPASNSVAFGATVTVKDENGLTESYTIVGVDELDLEPDAVSWISPIGKALLSADMGDSLRLADGRTAKIVKIERKNDTRRESSRVNRKRDACATLKSACIITGLRCMVDRSFRQPALPPQPRDYGGSRQPPRKIP